MARSGSVSLPASVLNALLTQAASHVDVAVGAAMFSRHTRSAVDRETESIGHAERMLALRQIAELYDRPEHYDEARSFFPVPPPLRPTLTRVRRLSPTRATPAGGDVIDATWPSAYQPHDSAAGEVYLSHEANRTAAARLYLHADRPRPAVMLIHGYLCGQWAIEGRVWPIDWLFAHGLDVVLTVLPFHAVRANRGSPTFPSSNPRITNEGFRQAVHDLRGLSHFLRDRGARDVGAMGMSLGGYMTALLATIDEHLSFAVPIIPLASIADLVRTTSKRFVGTPEEQAFQYQAVETALRVVSPLARPPRMPSPRDRMLVIAASGDRITPPSHARSIAEHFEAPLEVLPGGHLLQFWRPAGFRAAGKLLRRIGVMD